MEMSIGGESGFVKSNGRNKASETFLILIALSIRTIDQTKVVLYNPGAQKSNLRDNKDFVKRYCLRCCYVSANLEVWHGGGY